jgi:hypothetical protein
VITEFGACLTEGPCTQEISQVADVSDEFLVGWAYWQLKYYGDLTTSAGVGSEGFYNHDGSLQEWKVKALSRTYLMSTQGVPTYQNFDMKTSNFSATFEVNSSINAPTVVYLNQKYYYPEGFNYTLSVPADFDLSDSRYIKFQITDPTTNGSQVSIKITKK